ncbi:MAG: acetylglutamate kinase [Luteibaculum sp.]
MPKKLKVIKVGGNVINDKEILHQFLDLFAKIEEPKILVHGGGSIASELAETFQIPPKMVQGRRVTDGAMLDIVVMSYAGLINKNIVASLQKRSCNAMGLSGADANYFKTVKRPVEEIDYGFVGDCVDDSVNVEFLKLLLENGITPTSCAITHDTQGNLFNTNADTIAASIAKAMSKDYEVELIYCFELPGLLRDIELPDSKIDTLNLEKIEALKKDGTIHSGMHPKIDNCKDAILNGVSKVFICHWKDVVQPKNGTSILGFKEMA